MSEAGMRKQAEILRFIDSFQQTHGYAPTVREIGEAVHLSSSSSVQSHLRKLTERGLLIRADKKSRTMQIAEQAAEPLAAAPAAEAPVADNDFLYRHEVDSIPLVGNVAAGMPILAEENVEDAFPLPTDFVRGDSSNTFLLNVHGDSMINAGILNGDYVVVHSQQTAHNGEIVVAMIDDSATVKTFYKEKDHIRLQPENDFYEPIIVRDNVQILGKVVALLRRM